MKIILFLIILFSSSVFINAQNQTIEPTINNCEESSAHLDGLIDILRSNNEILFVVARLGTKESSREFNRRRLYNIRIYFTETRGFEAKRFVFAEGEKVNGLGRVEFYIGSSLKDIFGAKRNKDICVDCCGFPDTRYYGQGKIDKRSRRKK
jgi:CTP-dependent riboflavin kinase